MPDGHSDCASNQSFESVLTICDHLGHCLGRQVEQKVPVLDERSVNIRNPKLKAHFGSMMFLGIL